MSSGFTLFFIWLCLAKYSAAEYWWNREERDRCAHTYIDTHISQPKCNNKNKHKNKNNDKIDGFLGLSWGIIADVDIGSESLRWMGGLRMTVGAIAAICTFRTYPGEFWYLPIENTPTVAPVDVAAAGAVGAGKGKEKGEEEGKGGGGEGDAQVVGAGAGEGEDGGDGNSSGGSSSSGSAVVGRPALRCLPANGGAVEPREEDGWKCIQCEDHLLWWAMQITHGSYDNYTAPGAVFGTFCPFLSHPAPLPSPVFAHMHTSTIYVHSCTHARTHARTHAHTQMMVAFMFSLATRLQAAVARCAIS